MNERTWIATQILKDLIKDFDFPMKIIREKINLSINITDELLKELNKKPSDNFTTETCRHCNRSFEFDGVSGVKLSHVCDLYDYLT